MRDASRHTFLKPFKTLGLAAKTHPTKRFWSFDTSRNKLGEICSKIGRHNANQILIGQPKTPYSTSNKHLWKEPSPEYRKALTRSNKGKMTRSQQVVYLSTFFTILISRSCVNVWLQNEKFCKQFQIIWSHNPRNKYLENWRRGHQALKTEILFTCFVRIAAFPSFTLHSFMEWDPILVRRT